MSILHELYYGNISPWDKKIGNDGEYAELAEKLIRYTDELRRRFSVRCNDDARDPCKGSDRFHSAVKKPLPCVYRRTGAFSLSFLKDSVSVRIDHTAADVRIEVRHPVLCVIVNDKKLTGSDLHH